MTAHFPRPAILDRFSQSRHAVIEASAGTGKTYTIEHMVVDLILRRACADHRDSRPYLHRASSRRVAPADSIQDRINPPR